MKMSLKEKIKIQIFVKNQKIMKMKNTKKGRIFKIKFPKIRPKLIWINKMKKYLNNNQK